MPAGVAAAVGLFDSGNDVHIVRKIVLEIALDGDANPEKKNECTGVRSRKMVAARPLKEVVSMGRGSCRMNPLLWGRGEDIDGARHKKLWRNMALVPP